MGQNISRAQRAFYSIEATEESYDRALSRAAMRLDEVTIRYLLKIGREGDYQPDLECELPLASDYRHLSSYQGAGLWPLAVAVLAKDNAVTYRYDFENGEARSQSCRATRNRWSVVKTLVAEGADINHQHSATKASLLMLCLDEGLNGRAKELMTRYKAAVGLRDAKGDTALSHARGEEMVEFLVEAGCIDLEQPNRKFEKHSQLYYAWKLGRLDTAKTLLEGGASWDYKIFSLPQPEWAASIFVKHEIKDFLDKKGRSALHFCVREFSRSCGDGGRPAATIRDSISTLLEAGCDVNKTDDKLRSAWYLACVAIKDLIVRKEGEAKKKPAIVLAEMVLQLLENGADPNNGAPRGAIPPFSIICLCSALVESKRFREKFVSIIERLFEECLKRGADPNAQNDSNSTPLLLICNKCKDAIWRLHATRRLLEEGADPNLGCCGVTPLFIACRNAFYPADPVVESLLKAGANPDGAVESAPVVEKDNENENALPREGDELIGEEMALVLAGATPFSIYKRDWSHLLLDASSADLFLSYGANPNQTDDRGKTLFLRVCESWEESKSPQYLRLALKRGADPNRSGPQGETPFLAFCEKAALKFKSFFSTEDEIGLTIKTLRSFLKHGANPNLQNLQGNTPFLTACRKWNMPEQGLRLFLKHGANPNQKNSRGDTPFLVACKNMSERCLYLFLEDGAIFEDLSGEAALFHFAERNFAGGVLFLLKKGISPNCKDARGLSALMICAKLGSVKMCKLLLENGADVYARDENWMTAAIIAARDRQFEILLQLLAFVSAREQTVEAVAERRTIEALIAGKKMPK